MQQIEKLTAKEEEIMRVLWKLEKAFVKEIMPHLEEAHYNTISTMVRNLEDKGYVAYHAFGKTHQYFPVVTQEDYSSLIVNATTQRFFDGSYKNLVSFFAENEKISADDLREIIQLIEKK
jgi:predicted transcriptional regulator